MNIRIKALLMIAMVAGLASCKKNDDAPPVVQPATSINFVNTSANTINFFLNGTRINNATSYYPGGTVGYIPVASGAQNYQVKISGPDNQNPLFGLTQTFDTGKLYSVYVSGQTAESLFFTNDVLVRPNADSVKIRFVNGSLDAEAQNMGFQIKDSKGVVLGNGKFNNVAYKTTSDFIATKSGNFALSVYAASSPTASLRDTTVTLSSGKIYTIYSYKLGNNQGFRAGLVANQ